MADDDIKPDAEESAEEVEAVAAETTAEGDGGEAPTKQPEAAAAEQPADEAQLPQRLMPLPTNAEVADAEAADSNLSGSDDDGAEQSESEDGASGDGNDVPQRNL